MGRHPRLPSETGYYHVVSRGNQRQCLFYETTDYVHYCRLLAASCRAHQLAIAHFCLMPNHVHLLLHATDITQLSAAMHYVQRRYWFWTHRHREYTGHLWQGRFHSFPITDESYLLQAARYIERNALEAKLVNAIEEYPWSSYSFYALGQRYLFLSLTPTPTYVALGKTPRTRQKGYRRFVDIPQPYDHGVRRILQKVTAYA